MPTERQDTIFAPGTEAALVRPDLVPTRALLRHRSCGRVLDQIRRTLHFFPELTGSGIRVGLTRSAYGYAAVEEFKIWMNPYRLSLQTIAHELTHLLQNRGLVPGGEKNADLYALARHFALLDELPHYLRVPPDLRQSWYPENVPLRRLIHRTAREAVTGSARGPRRSIRWFEETLRERWLEKRSFLVPGDAPPSQMALL